MNKNNSNKKNYNSYSAGFSILEVLLAIVFFTTGMIGIGLVMIDVLDTVENANNLNQGLLIAREGIEAVKTIRDSDLEDEVFDEVINGTYGLELNDTEWSLDADPGYDITMAEFGASSKDFTRTITIADSNYGVNTAPDTTVKLITSTVSWPRRNGNFTTSLQTYVTWWDRPAPEIPEP